jgi:hypothetical protein
MTTDRPRVNHCGFVVRPKNAVLAIVASDRLDDCAAALAAVGVDLSRVDVLQGQAGADILDFDGTEHGLWAHVVRTLQKLGSASNERENYARALRDGQSVFIVPVLGHAEADACARVLHEHGGRRILHLSAYVAEQLSY